jgi:hypothetical protein
VAQSIVNTRHQKLEPCVVLLETSEDVFTLIDALEHFLGVGLDLHQRPVSVGHGKWKNNRNNEHRMSERFKVIDRTKATSWTIPLL